MKEAYEWICNIIESCNNPFHFESVDKLIELFNKRYGNEELTIKLIERRCCKAKNVGD